MSGINPVILIQLLMQYHNTRYDALPRTFAFNRNNRMRAHRETPEEVTHRRSFLTAGQVDYAESAVRDLLKNSLKGKTGKVWVDRNMRNIAVPLNMSTAQSGFGVLPTGSRVDIPEGQFVRAFTYWEKVNDIDLSCFALTKTGEKEEFSWRNMWGKQSEAITFSGDQTSGYKGGSEYFDINIDLFKAEHPDYRYIVVCDNVYSDVEFNKIDCTAGFMIREENLQDVPKWKGESERNGRIISSNRPIFDPKTVQTSFKITSDTTFAYLFAIDLETRQMVWLNLSRADHQMVAGCTEMDFLLRFLTVTDVLNAYDLYSWAGEMQKSPISADIVVSDDMEIRKLFREDSNVEFIHSWDFEKMLTLLQPS